MFEPTPLAGKNKVAATEVKAPTNYDATTGTSIFLGGSIDQGEAENWQDKVARALDDLDVTILNPRRDDWDSSWEQSIDNPEFVQQVEWEIKAQEDADVLLYYFTKDSKSPVTMFEAGAWGTKGDCVLCVEAGFYREANLQIYARHWKVPIYDNFDDMIADLHTLLAEQVNG